MAKSSKFVLTISFIFGFCIFNLTLGVEGHILVYRRLINQVILIEEYNDMPAQFGPSLPTNGIKVFAIPVLPNEEACAKISSPPKSLYPDNAKFVAIIKRGGTNCTFESKVRQAQAARFDAVIVYNNESDDLEHMSAKNSSGILIPAVFVGHTTGINLKTFFTPEIVLVINDELPFNINTQLILPFSILIGLCFLIMIFYMIYKCIREERRMRRHRLPKRMLKKLPIIKFTKNSDLAYDTCVICLDEFAEGDKLRVLPCKHPYHSVCIDVWLTETKRECPICKRRVFSKGEAQSHRNRQSSLDSVTDTDDDTTPLLQHQQQPSTNSSINSSVATQNSTAPSTTSHGTFRRSGGQNIEASAGGDVTSDDENMLSPARRMNPFDRSPNLPPYLAAQLNNETRTRSFWSWPVFRWFRQPTIISVAAPPYLEDNFLQDVLAEQSAVAVVATEHGAIGASHSSNNVLNPNLGGSFKDDEEDDAPLQCIYEPVATTVSNSASATVAAAAAAETATAEATSTTTVNKSSALPQPVPANEANSSNETDSDFFQTPTQGGIAVAALPSNNIINNNYNNSNNNTNSTRFW